MAIAL